MKTTVSISSSQRVTLHLLYLTLINLSIIHNATGINQTHRLLIQASEAVVFPRTMDLEFEKFEVFERIFDRKEDEENDAFTSKENSEFVILVNKTEADMKPVLVEVEAPDEDALAGKICFVTSYIVFRPIRKFLDHFTSHIAHIRNIRGMISVEWDFFFSQNRDYKGQFVSAFAPDNDVEDKTTWESETGKGRSMGRSMRRLKKRIEQKAASSNANPIKEIVEVSTPTPPPSTFKGLGRCPETGNTIPMLDIVAGRHFSTDKIIEIVLEILQVNCLPDYFGKTKRLFNTNLLQPVQGIQVKFNLYHPILNSPFLTEAQWIDLVSAMYFYSFANAFTAGLNPNRTTVIQNDISPSVKNLIGMSVQIIGLTRLKGFKPHIVKIITTMMITAKAAAQYYAAEKESLEGCFDCKAAATLNHNNAVKVNGLISVLNCKVEQLLVP